MVRTYKRKPGARRYRDYSDEMLAEAIAAVKEKKMSQLEAEKKFKIPRRTISVKILGLYKNKPGSRTIYSETEEEAFVEALSTLAEWGFPMTLKTFKSFVKKYNEEKGVKIDRFRDNTPGDDWVHGFLKRHPKLTKKSAATRTRNRASDVTREKLEAYYENLKLSLADIPADRIFNFDETAFQDSNTASKVLARRRTRVERIMNSTKTLTSVMFCGAAGGVLLPPYICYKATKNKKELKLRNFNGPKGEPFCQDRCCRRGCRYGSSGHGWFDSAVFKDWFERVFLTHVRRMNEKSSANSEDSRPPPTALIGDNVRAHFTPEVVKLAKENNIKFIVLPPNSTHLTQPLDVSFFAPMKRKWRQISENFRMRDARKAALAIPNEAFASLLKEVFEEIGVDQTRHNLIVGFAKSGIFPLDKEKVLSQLPKTPQERAENGELIKTALSNSVMEFLQDLRYRKRSSNKEESSADGASVSGKNQNTPRRKRPLDSTKDGKSPKCKKRLKLTPGKNMAALSEESDVEESTTVQYERTEAVEEIISSDNGQVAIHQNECCETAITVQIVGSCDEKPSYLHDNTSSTVSSSHREKTDEKVAMDLDQIQRASQGVSDEASVISCASQNESAAATMPTSLEARRDQLEETKVGVGDSDNPAASARSQTTRSHTEERSRAKKPAKWKKLKSALAEMLSELVDEESEVDDDGPSTSTGTKKKSRSSDKNRWKKVKFALGRLLLESDESGDESGDGESDEPEAARSGGCESSEPAAIESISGEIDWPTVHEYPKEEMDGALLND